MRLTQKEQIRDEGDIGEGGGKDHGDSGSGGPGIGYGSGTGGNGQQGGMIPQVLGMIQDKAIERKTEELF